MLLYIIDRVSTSTNRHTIQKLVYFINLYTDRYNFRWTSSGPFSQELSYHLDDLAFERYVSNWQNHDSDIPSRHNARLMKDRRQHRSRIDRVAKGAADKILNLMKKKNARELDLLASVHYLSAWARKSKKNLSKESVCRLIVGLMPNYEFTLEELSTAVEEDYEFSSRYVK